MTADAAGYADGFVAGQYYEMEQYAVQGELASAFRVLCFFFLAGKGGTYIRGQQRGVNPCCCPFVIWL